MAGYEKKAEGEGEETSSRGVDWEVVSLTASAYAYAPVAEETSLIDGSRERNWDEYNSEYAREMFMSGHFVFPPAAHENLPVESDYSDILAESKLEDADMIEEEAGEEETRTVQSLACGHGEEDEGGNDSPRKSSSSSSMAIDFSECRRSEVPCESWWRRRAATVYAQAKEAGAFWSLCAAAALMGLVIFGQRWNQERCKIRPFDSRFGIGEERMSRLLRPVNRFKYVISGGPHRRSPAASYPSL